MRTALNATKIAIAAFIVPYIFAFNPVMLLEGMDGWITVIIPVITAIGGLFGVAAGLNGNLFVKIPWVLRIALIAAGLALMIPEAVSDIVGAAVIIAIFVIQYFLKKRESKVEALPEQT